MTSVALAGGSNTSSQRLSQAFVILASLATLYAAWPIWRSFLPLEIDYNEFWNAYHADRVRSGQPLHPDPSGLIINNYPPLSFYLLGALSATGVDALYIGRALSIFSVAATAGAIGCLIRQFQGSQTAATIGAVWFIATFARFFDGYFGMNDPNLVALAMMACGLAWLVRRRDRGRTPDPAIILMVIAGFYKHNLFAVPLTAIFWLSLSDRPAAMRAALVGIGTVAIGIAFCVLAYGPVFLKSLLMPREYSLVTAVAAIGRLQWIAPALVIFAVWAWRQRHGEAVRFSVSFVVIAFIFQFAQKMGAGVADNAQFELMVATAVGLGLAFQNVAAIPAPAGFDSERKRIVIVLILITRLLLDLRVSPYLLVTSPEFRANLRERSAISANEVARIGAIPGPVICSVPVICRWAGKSFLYDPFFVHQSIATGTRSSETVDNLLRALGARDEQVDVRSVVERR